MDYHQKLKNIPETLKLVTEWKAQGKKIVHCHGNFNVVHPGHLRFLEFAKKQGDILLITISSDQSLGVALSKHFFDENERARGVCAVNFVECVAVMGREDLLSFLENAQPDICVKGREHEQHKDYNDVEEENIVKKNGGKVVYGAGRVDYSSSELLHQPAEIIKEQGVAQLQKVCTKQNIELIQLLSIIRKYKQLKMLVIGDTIVDQYIACDPIGMSAEAPVIAVKEIDKKEFLGGAGIVACHIKSLGAKCTYLSVVGNDKPAVFAKDVLDEHQVKHILIEDSNRPTTYKKRFMVNNQKLFRVSRIKEQTINEDLENKVIKNLELIIPTVDGVVISDFSYGLVSPRVLKYIQSICEKHNVRIFADSQCSSQIGDVSKFKSIDLITPTEREARIALRNNDDGLERLGYELLLKTSNQNVIITLGAKGVIAFGRKEINGKLVNDSVHFPTLVSNPLDPAGAGDAMLSAISLSLCAGANIKESTLIGSCASAIQVERLGNIPINMTELESLIIESLRYSKSDEDPMRLAQ
ncbi:hypothetical protein BVY03_04250 [bacterium K02(2017)]|nr:hypothetical protein BVY03_04250 [bacterium K02(2017)]